MAFLPPLVGPRTAFRDLGAFLRQRSREQVIGGMLAFLCTVIIVIVFFVDSQINTAPPAQIVYVEQWKADRSDEEIIAQQRVDQAKREAAELERRRQFQKLERQLGL